MSPEPFLGVAQSLTRRRWQLRPVAERLAEALAQRHHLPEIVGRVLVGRGVDLETAPGFLRPTLRDSLPDPFGFQDMDAAVARTIAALRAGEKITIFGDYDVDGATSSALLLRFLRAVGGEVDAYIPDRLAEGYGPNAPALRALKDKGTSLVITVDCGTLSYEPLQAAADVGLDVVVVDHHKAEPALPRAVAVINPNRLDEDGAFGQMAAVGVSFVFAVALNARLRSEGWYADGCAEPNLMQHLDLVALGTVCDVVPLTGPNRAFVAQGLKVMAQRRNIGLTALADVAGLDSAPSTYHLGFLLGPRVNAGGRVGASDLGTRLLTTENPEEARRIAEHLDALNKERQAIEAAVLEDALSREGLGDDPVTFVIGEGWHPGVIGIVASRLKEKTNRPSVVLALDGGVAKGSARSISGVDIGAAVIDAAHHGHIMGGGGHAMAAGMTVARSQLDAFRDFLNARLGTAVKEAVTGLTLELDGVLSVRGANADLVDILETVGPYGVGHPNPRFALSGVEVVKADVVGADHVRLMVAGRDGGRLKVMAFRAAEQEMGQTLLRGVGRKFHLAGRLRRDDWGAVARAEMHLEDAAPV